MIAKISRGADTAGLLRYLLGPGRANEHSDPHLIASWDGDPAALEPVVVHGRPQVRGLAALLDQPLEALQRRPERTVWHCSLRNAPGDRRLSDQEWSHVARRVLDRVGLAPSGDAGGCRWIAARHGEDHVHLLVVLARQDGRPVRTPNDYRRAGEACRQLERHFGLAPTPARDSTAVQRPSRPEKEKAGRAGREESAREILRREVRIASIAAVDPQAFLDELRRSGLIVKARYSFQDPGRLTGYAVAWPGDHAPGGRPVWFSGSTLAPDLSLPRLQQRWDGVRDEVARLRPSRRGEPQHRTDWASILRVMQVAATVTDTPADLATSTHAAASALTAVARALEGPRGGALTRYSTRLTNDLGRPEVTSGTRRTRELRLLAAAHLVLGASTSDRPGAMNAILPEKMLLDLLQVIASASAPDSRSRDHAAVRQMLDSVEGRDGADHPGASSIERVRAARGGRTDEKTLGHSARRDSRSDPHRGR